MTISTSATLTKASASAVGLSLSAPMILGAPLEALGCGLAAATISAFWLAEVKGLLRAAVAIVGSAMLAGLGSPVCAEWLAQTQEGFVHNDTLRNLLAVGIGLAGPALVPTLFERARKLIKTGRLS